MTPHLTSPNQELERLIRQTPEGMMFWSGTCSDPSATCDGCKHFGYETVVRNDAGNVVTSHKHTAGCALYQKHTGRHSKAINKQTPACKYFEKKQP